MVGLSTILVYRISMAKSMQWVEKVKKIVLSLGKTNNNRAILSPSQKSTYCPSVQS